MSRLKDLLRVEAAVEGNDLAELEWAIAFSSHKLRLLRLKQNIDMWHQLRTRAVNRRHTLLGTAARLSRPRSRRPARA